MFVRWKRVPRRPKWYHDTREVEVRYSLSAQLVASSRKDGKVRQKVILHLGAISEDNIPFLVFRGDFWQKAMTRLSTLTLDPLVRRQIRQALRAKVPRPTPKEMAKLSRMRDEMAASSPSGYWLDVVRADIVRANLVRQGQSGA